MSEREAQCVALTREGRSGWCRGRVQLLAA